MLKFLLISVFILTNLFLAACSNITNKKKQIEAAHINTSLGLLYLEQGYPKIAQEKLLVAYKKAPYDPEVCNALGYFFSHMGESSVANRYYLFAIKFAKEKSWFWHSYGRFLFQQGYYKEALNCFLLVAKDLDYLYVAEAYADASRATFKLDRKDLAKKYHNMAIIRGFKPKIASERGSDPFTKVLTPSNTKSLQLF